MDGACELYAVRASWEGGSTLCTLPSVGSTNDVAIEAARDGAPHGWAVCAERQVAGRGRRGHAWASPKGSLYLSCVLRPQVTMAQFIALPAVCALGVMDALHELGLAGRVGIKWPNDIVARRCADTGAEGHSLPAGEVAANSLSVGALFDSKLVGILVEAKSAAEGPFAVVGMGMNVVPVEVDPNMDDRPATGPRPLAPISLEELLAYSDARPGGAIPSVPEIAEALRAAVVARVDAWAAELTASDAAAGPFAPILSEYFDLVPMLGHQVVALTPDGHPLAVGVFTGLDVWGRATLAAPDGAEQAFPSEAVSLREV